ncbi:uncharacterized protein LOC143277842 [Babylonia areolata]|uniref:uncharacterized protein LOC143277842 n=1 Tax=Babylonia areolata TaxID=304850 RepID=UPI003FCF5BE7
MVSTTTLAPLTLTTPLSSLTLTPSLTNGSSSGTGVTLNPEEQEELQNYMSVLRSIKESYMWVILAFGFPGNVLCLVVMGRMRSLGSPALYIGTLAVVDNLAIVVKLMLVLFGQHKVSVGIVGCKLLFFLGNQLVVYANWVLVAMAIERFFAVWQPLRVARTWTSHRAALGLGVLLLVTIALTSPLFVTVTVKDVGSRQACVVDPEYRQMMLVWQWGQVAAYGFLPCSLLFTLNISITVLIGRARRLHLSLTSSSSFKSSPGPHSTSATNTTTNNQPTNRRKRSHSRHHNNSNSAATATAAAAAALRTATTRPPKRTGSRPRSSGGGGGGGVQRQATILLLVTSGVLVMTTTPVCVYMLVQQWWRPEAGSLESARKRLWSLVLRVLCDCNHAVNFYLYFISARKFRAYLWKVLCWICLRQKERRGSDVITRHFSTSRSTLRVRNSAQGHLLASPGRSCGEGEEGMGNTVPLKVFEAEEAQCNGGTHCTSLL